jgi:hypothetical protein
MVLAVVCYVWQSACCITAVSVLVLVYHYMLCGITVLQPCLISDQ